MTIPLVIPRRRLLVPGGGGGSPLVAIGGASAAAASFVVNPLSLGAQDGDFMLVASVWESSNAVSTPAGWTEDVDEQAAFGNAFARWSWASRIFSGTPPGDQTFSYGGSNNVAWNWVILRGVTGIGTITKNTPTLGTGSFSFAVTIGSEGALAWVCYDGGAQDPTAVADMTNIAANGRAEDIAGMYGELAWIDASDTIVAATSPFDKGIGGYMWAPVN